MRPPSRYLDSLTVVDGWLLPYLADTYLPVTADLYLPPEEDFVPEVLPPLAAPLPFMTHLQGTTSLLSSTLAP